MEKLTNFFRNLIFKHRTKIQHFFVVTILMFAKPNKFSLIFGLVFIIFGIFIRVWAVGYIKKMEFLTVEGPYSYIRNPLYFGSFFIGLGLCICSFNLFFLLIYLVLFYLIYCITIIEEEKILKSTFAEQYEKYKESVPSFIPIFKTKSSFQLQKAKSKWDFYGFLKNKEYEGVIFNLFGFLFLLFLHFIFKGNRSLIDFVLWKINL